MKKNSGFEMRKRESLTSKSRLRKKDINRQKWKHLKGLSRKSKKQRNKSNNRFNRLECNRC